MSASPGFRLFSRKFSEIYAAKNLHEFSRFSDPEKDFGEGRFATFSFFVDIFRWHTLDLAREVVWLWTRDALVQYFGSVKKHDNWKA